MIIPQALPSGAVEPHTEDIHPLADCSGEVVTEDEDGFHSAYYHRVTSTLQVHGLGLPCGCALALPCPFLTTTPCRMLGLRHTQPTHFYSAGSHYLFGLCLGEKIYYPFWVTQLLHECSCP